MASARRIDIQASRVGCCLAARRLLSQGQYLLEANTERDAFIGEVEVGSPFQGRAELRPAEPQQAARLDPSPQRLVLPIRLTRHANDRQFSPIGDPGRLVGAGRWPKHGTVVSAQGCEVEPQPATRSSSSAGAPHRNPVTLTR